LDFEDLRQPHIYQLLVTATEDSGGFSTSVELTIRNAHKFQPFLSFYVEIASSFYLFALKTLTNFNRL
jgi:hypothetical protein